MLYVTNKNRIAQLLLLRIKSMVPEMQEKNMESFPFVFGYNIKISLCKRKKINRSLVNSLSIPQNKKPKLHFCLSFKNSSSDLLKILVTS